MNAYEMADELLRDNTQLTVKAAYMLRQQADRIAHLEMLVANRNEIIDKLDLTTPQIKELSDEEIWEVIDNCFGVHAFNLDYQIALDEAREDAFDLVKTILKKASE